MVGHLTKSTRSLPSRIEPLHRQHTTNPNHHPQHAFQQCVLVRLDAGTVCAKYDGGVDAGGGRGTTGLLAGGASIVSPAAASKEKPPSPPADTSAVCRTRHAVVFVSVIAIINFVQYRFWIVLQHQRFKNESKFFLLDFVYYQYEICEIRWWFSLIENTHFCR